MNASISTPVFCLTSYTIILLANIKLKTVLLKSLTFNHSLLSFRLFVGITVSSVILLFRMCLEFMRLICKWYQKFPVLFYIKRSRSNPERWDMFEFVVCIAIWNCMFLWSAAGSSYWKFLKKNWEVNSKTRLCFNRSWILSIFINYFNMWEGFFKLKIKLFNTSNSHLYSP